MLHECAGVSSRVDALICPAADAVSNTDGTQAGCTDTICILATLVHLQRAKKRRGRVSLTDCVRLRTDQDQRHLWQTYQAPTLSMCGIMAVAETNRRVGAAPARAWGLTAAAMLVLGCCK